MFFDNSKTRDNLRIGKNLISPNHSSIHQLNGMDSVLLCSSGLSTSIWSVDEELKLFREISIASGSCRALDWNQNSKLV